MFYFSKKEIDTRKLIKKVISIVDSISNKSISPISLMMVGSRAFKNDVTKDSDLDMCLILSRKNNKILLEKIESEIYNKIQLKYPRLVYLRFGIHIYSIDQFYSKSLSKKEKHKIRFIRKYGDCFKVIYGLKINFENFPVKPLSIKEEISEYLNYASQNLDYMLSNNYNMPGNYKFMNYVKLFLKLTYLEHQYHNLIYAPSYELIIKNIEGDNNHIAKLAYQYRKKGEPFSIEEKKYFIKTSQPFIDHFKKLLKKLD